ncbi:MAG: hypothetical protein U0T82_00975 [Bacteroidales bacterium]
MKTKKIIFLLFAPVLFNSISFGQIQRGALLTGSSASFYHAVKPTKYTTYNISPDLGILVTDNLGVLGELYAGGGHAEDFDQFGFGGYLSLRFYPVPGEQAAFLFYRTGGGYNSVKSSSDYSYESYDFIPGLGLDIFLNEHVAVEGQLGYDFGVNNNNGSKNKTQDLYLTIGLQVFFHLE